MRFKQSKYLNAITVATYEMENIATADIIHTFKNQNQTSKYKYQTKNPRERKKIQTSKSRKKGSEN